MHSIFWKIFFSFWLATVLIIGVAIMGSFKIAAERLEAIDEFDRREALTQGATVFQQQGLRGFEKWVDQTELIPPDQTLYLINSQGLDAFSRRLPRKIREPHFIKKLRRSDRAELRKKLTGKDSLEFVDANGTEYWPVFGNKEPPIFGVLGIPRNALFMLLAGMLISAAVCYFLAKYLTWPLGRMISASRDLADGDLSSRVGSEVYRSDEIGQLAQQFDNMAEKFEQQVDSRRTLFRNISHEVRSPLARIKVALELARRKPDEAVQQFQRIESETDNIDHLVSQALTLVRAQQYDEEKQSIDLVNIVERVISDAVFEGLPDNKSVSLNAPETPVLVAGRQALIHSMIENVIRNALAYTTDGTEVEVTIVREGDTVKLQVRDHGPGVPEAELKQIFEPFYRGSTSSVRMGSGIGLAITAQGIETMKGTLVAENVAQGGLLVTLTVPIMQQRARLDLR